MANEKSTSVIKVHHCGDLHWVGNGFPVRSVFSYNDLGRQLNPFLLLDYAAPYRFSPGNEKRGVGEHPHRGFETVTIAYQGEIEHRDSSGGGGDKPVQAKTDDEDYMAWWPMFDVVEYLKSLPTHTSP